MSITQQDLDRINALARKSKAKGLTDAELQEQKLLRQRYVEAVRRNLRGQLENIDLVDEHGNVENVGDRYRKNHPGA